MFTRPPDITDLMIVEALRTNWGIDVSAVEYSPVGFGSHHWRTDGGAGDWFVTVDDLDARRRDRTDTISTACRELLRSQVTAIDDDVVELYRLSWDLNEVAIYVSQFRRDHIDSEDITEAWTNLQHCLEPGRW